MSSLDVTLSGSIVGLPAGSRVCADLEGVAEQEGEQLENEHERRTSSMTYVGSVFVPSACWFICLYRGIGSHVLIATDYIYVKRPITSDLIMYDIDRD